nr:hypothetical protein CFP56_67658 [Quercus suber]
MYKEVDSTEVDFPKNPPPPSTQLASRRSIPGEEPRRSTNPGEAKRRRTQAKNPATPTSKTDEQANAGADEPRRRFLHQTPTNPATPTAKHKEHADFFTRPRRSTNPGADFFTSDEARTQAPISSPEPRRRTRSGTAKHEEHASLVVRFL